MDHQSRFDASQRDGMGKAVGGGFRMGNTCTPMADSCQCMAKPIQYCKVKKKKKEHTHTKKIIMINYFLGVYGNEICLCVTPSDGKLSF